MSGYISPAHRDAKEVLTLELAALIGQRRGGIAEAARTLKMDPHDLAAVLRMDRAVSLSKLSDIGAGLGLELRMKWRHKHASS
jgi:hypothetical protein